MQDIAIIPDHLYHSFLKHSSKPGNDHRKLNGYSILTMQNTIGKLMERIVAREFARDLEDRNILPANQGDFRPGKCTREMQLHLHMICMKDSR